MPTRRRGLYELLVTDALVSELEGLDADLLPILDRLGDADAGDRLAQHLAGVVRWAISTLPVEGRVDAALRLVRDLVAHVDAQVGDAVGDSPASPGRILHAIVGRLPDGAPESFERPLIPLLDTTLLTNAPGEPRVGHQITTEIASADRVDVLMAFIRRSGIRPMLEALRALRGRGGALRVLTTVYTGSTQAEALDDLTAAGADVRVSYDTSATRLHAKAWIFARDSGYSTASIGSSNLTYSAQVSGLEWNVRVSAARNPDVLAKMEAVFETYWNGGDFVPYERDEFLLRTQSARDPLRVVMSPVELRPEPFQERLLEQIALARERGVHRNLLVSATGTGKTVMAAIDYARLCGGPPRARLLFVAHRAEILEKSLSTFRHALRDHAFGELWVGGRTPTRFEHVFASIQSLNATGYAHFSPDHFDVIVIDEFHHAAAQSYQALLDAFTPRELLALTATPERSDGLPVVELFEAGITAELRLWDAIDQHRLAPFLYYGIADGVDLRAVPWRRGRGYDVAGLSSVLTADEHGARHVARQLLERADDVSTMRVLGFCVDVAHARFMARVFAAIGIPSTAIWGDSPADERAAALDDLGAGRIRVLFSVDLFNEGIDLPAVDTLLLLRPTDSPTLFLQQLGRGLRLHHGKSACTVLDFVGQHRKEFRYDRRFGALLGGSRRQLAEQIENRFPFLPAGCHLELDPVASRRVLENIRAAVPTQWAAKAAELRALAAGRSEQDVGLTEFLAQSGLELDDVYAGGRCWSDLRDAAGLPTAPPGPGERALRRACGRLLHVDDPERIESWRRLVRARHAPHPENLPERERRLLRMLVASLAKTVLRAGTTLADGARLLWEHPQVLREVDELLDVLPTRIDHLTPTLDARPDVPLRLHGRYTRTEILAAFGVGEDARVAPWQTGVRWVPEAEVDLLAFTLDKSGRAFSPTTRYEDYAVSRELVHWQSQAAVRAGSETGRRYREHAARGSDVMLFARLRDDDKAFWFLGPATYVSHRSERPMSILWRLTHPLAGDMFTAFAAAVA